MLASRVLLVVAGSLEATNAAIWTAAVRSRRCRRATVSTSDLIVTELDETPATVARISLKIDWFKVAAVTPAQTQAVEHST